MSSTRNSREELVAALNLAMREASGQAVLYSQAVAQRLSMNSTDLECLDFIISQGPATAGALAEATGLTTGAITGVIDRLERVGFARRQRDNKDRRKVLVHALPAVDKQIAPLFEPMQRAAISALSSYRDDELMLLLDFFGRARSAAHMAMAELAALAPSRRKPGRAKPRERPKAGSPSQ
ncbi:MAG: MarR family transcriptional regulator [Rhodomicrobium sp.]